MSYDGDETSEDRVRWLVYCFRQAFEENSNSAGFTGARKYEMLNALAMEAASIICEPPDVDDQADLRKWFLRALGECIVQAEDEQRISHPH
jgi:hypothetical protein